MDRKKYLDAGNRAIQKLFGFFADRVSNALIDDFNRPDYTDFLEGSGYFIENAKESAGWRIGYAKRSMLPEDVTGTLYLGGYLAFPPNRVSGVLNDQMFRATALDDGSSRGIHVFAVADCIGLSNTDVREIRRRLRPEIDEFNIESLNICATHCHSGVDTLGLWGDLRQALKNNPKAVKSKKKSCFAVSGRDPDFMEQFFDSAAECIRSAIADMRPGSASFASVDAAAFVRDKRPPNVIDPALTILRFNREGEKPLYWTVLGAHPTCYGDKQREISADYPYYICSELEDNGAEAVFFQGAQAAIATARGNWSKPTDTNQESIERYGRAVAAAALALPAERYEPLAPILNVRISKVLLPVDNQILLLAAKLRLVDHKLNKFPRKKKKHDYYFNSEIGYAQLGSSLTLAMIPGELMPELAYGGAFSAENSATGADWDLPPLKACAAGHFAVLGLCNDTVGYIVPDNDFGNFLTENHYEEAVSPGKRTASELVSAFFRTVEEAEKTRI